MTKFLAPLLVLMAAPAALQAQWPAATLRLLNLDGDTIAVSVAEPATAALAASAATARTVVIVPGLLGSGFSFRAVVEGLQAAGFRSVVVDPLGTGRSGRPARADYSLEAQAARVQRVMAELGMERAVLLCHSVGASICYRLALRAPARVQGVVSVNGGPDERAATPGLRLAMKFAPLIRLFGGAGRVRGRIREGLLGSAGADSAWVTEALIDEYTRPYTDFDATLRALKGMASAEEPAALRPRLPQLSVPVVLLVGAGNPDAAVSADDLAALQAIPDLTIERVPGAGQYIQEEDPAAIIRAVRSLWRR